MLEPDGNILTAERIDITDDFRDGFIGSLNVVTIDRAHFSAQTAERRDGNLTDLPQGHLHRLRALPATSRQAAALADQGGAHHPRPSRADDLLRGRAA